MTVRTDTATTFLLDLPSETKIVFRVPTYRDRQIALKRYKQQVNETGFLLEELIAATMLVSIDGVEVPNEAQLDVLERMADWPLKDLTFYLEVFLSIAFLDDLMKQRAQTVAKSLLEGKSVATPQASPTSTTAYTAVAV